MLCAVSNRSVSFVVAVALIGKNPQKTVLVWCFQVAFSCFFQITVCFFHWRRSRSLLHHNIIYSVTKKLYTPPWREVSMLYYITGWLLIRKVKYMYGANSLWVLTLMTQFFFFYPKLPCYHGLQLQFKSCMLQFQGNIKARLEKYLLKAAYCYISLKHKHMQKID